jgi:hypothetical protein
VPSPLTSLRSRLARAGDFGRRKSPLLRRVPPLKDLIELAARLGYGARGFVYLSVGLLTLLAAADLIGDAVGTRGAIAWMALRPLGRLWLLLLGLGLCAFVMWRVLQAVFDADHEGTSRHGLGMRMSQGFSAMSYGFLAFNTFAFLIHTPRDPAAADVARSHEQAAMVLALPFGNWLLAAAGLTLLGIGLVNVSRSWREDFTEYLACSRKTCRRVAPLARAGYVARGLAYLPLAVLIIMAGVQAKASEVTSFGSALDTVERQPGGPWILALASLGFIAFGAFSFIEARFRRIKPPKDLTL